MGINGLNSHIYPINGVDMYFFGSFDYSIDARGRISLPARYRAAFINGAVIKESPDSCLELYTINGFETETSTRLGEHVSNRQKAGRQIRRNFLAGAFEVDLDSQGRILIPPQLRKLLGDEKNIAVIGCGDYVELWPLSVWEQELENQESLDE
ncbi:MAG: division/cell wall cluster transcriptional repressor MraZ [Chloroflexi bacterium]|nr:division/cell wall cluster transcriptional repressor MraZ [Chloroflexota bacterium]|tara:strand:+ start:221 stop:679 length:459 start_codon:yes stop_codon:yes gene_type:complete